MIAPNKVVTIESSALGLSMVVLDALSEPRQVSDLLLSVKKQFGTLDMFLLTLDLLFVLGRVEVDFQTGRISRVD